MMNHRHSCIRPGAALAAELMAVLLASFPGRVRAADVPDQIGERSRRQARLVANDVDGRVIAGSGHRLIDEAPGQVIPALLDFPGK